MNNLEQYYRIRQAAGVAIHVKLDGNIAIQVCSVSAQGNKLDINEKKINLAKVDELKKYLPARIPIALNLSGKGILQKRIERTLEVSQQNFHQILPNGNYEDFYVQNFISGEYSFVSLVRKGDADKWLSQLKELGLVPLMLSLGPFAINLVIEQLNIYDQDFQFGGHRVVRNESGEWTECLSGEKLTSAFPVKLASEKIDEKLIIPYAAAFQLVLAGHIEPVKTNVEILESVLQEKLSANKRKTILVLGLIILFTALMVNLIVFTFLSRANMQLADRLSTYQQDTQNLALLTEQIKAKEERLTKLGWDGGINKSILIDRVAALLPSEVTLQEIAVNPFQADKNHSGKALLFETRKIRIRGESERILPVNEWIARIKIQNWVKNVRLEDFIYNNELKAGQFTITVNY
jgi:hypothetical protein